ncbi:unnamed protein product [Rangifer tarandus platyrhynchus]|uniref:Uncharacterized protein n=2 Tax=Rangifer tarandus platyrhynchus TaxID=3082113 RepID=A0ABN8Z911_RANTA|nr:unnamed protein product [Rangifer tarandus platyrhynchus]
MYKTTPLEVKFCQSPREAVSVLFSESTPPSPPQVAPNVGPRSHDKLNTEKDSCRRRWRRHLGSAAVHTSTTKIPREQKIGDPHHQENGHNVTGGRETTGRKESYSSSTVPPWAQIKNLTRKAKDVLKETGTPLTPDKLFLGFQCLWIRSS